MKSGCGLIFPPRYHNKRSLTSKKDIVDAVIGCFKGECPRIMAHICLCEYIDNEHYNLLNKVVYLGIYGRVFNRSGSYFVEQVVQRSTYLEVVILEPEVILLMGKQFHWMDLLPFCQLRSVFSPIFICLRY